MTLQDPGRLAVANDDVSGVTNGTGGLVQRVIPATTQPDFNEIVFVNLP